MRPLSISFAPPNGDRLQLLLVWGVVIAATLIYWEACRLAHGAGSTDLRNSGLWMVEIWSGWLLLSFPAYEVCRRWSANGNRLPVRQVLGLMVAVSLLALCCEWLLNSVLSQLGIARWESPWAMFNRRALLCVVVSGAIVAFALKPGVLQRIVKRQQPSLDVDTSARVQDERPALVLMDRTGPVTVSLDEVEAILAAENYVQVCLADGKEYLHRITLAKLEKELDARAMIRVHRSAIVNVEKVSRRLPGWQLELASGRIVRVGRTFRAAVEEHKH